MKKRSRNLLIADSDDDEEENGKDEDKAAREAVISSNTSLRAAASTPIADYLQTIQTNFFDTYLTIEEAEIALGHLQADSILDEIASPSFAAYLTTLSHLITQLSRIESIATQFNPFYFSLASHCTRHQNQDLLRDMVDRISLSSVRLYTITFLVRSVFHSQWAQVLPFEPIPVCHCLFETLCCNSQSFDIEGGHLKHAVLRKLGCLYNLEPKRVTSYIKHLLHWIFLHESAISEDIFVRQVMEALTTIFVDSEVSVYLSSLRDFLFTLASILSNSRGKFERFITQLQYLYPIDMYSSFLKCLLSRSNLPSSRLAALNALEMVMKRDDYCGEEAEVSKVLTDIGMLDPSPIVRLKAAAILLPDSADINVSPSVKTKLRFASIKARDLDESVRRTAMTYLIESGAAAVVGALSYDEVVAMTKSLLKTISCVHPHNADFDLYVRELGK